MVEPERRAAPRALTSVDSIGAQPAGDAPQFDAYYYTHDCGLPYERTDEWLALFARFADHIVEELHPQRVLDVGCAKGFLVEALCARGVDAWGIDVSEYAIGEVDESVSDRCFVAGITDKLPEGLPGGYDLVTCIEVVEHIPGLESAAAIERLSALSDRILFSSDPGDYAEATHVSVRPQEDWSALFARNGRFRNLDADVSFLTPWAVLYESADDHPDAIVRRYDRAFVRVRDEIRSLRATAIRLQGEIAHLEDEDVEQMRSDLEAARAHIEELERAHAHESWILSTKTGRVLQAYHAMRSSLRRDG